MRKDRETRQFQTFEIRANPIQRDEKEYEELYVEGYAATFEEPTVLYEYEGIEYKEKIDPMALTQADMRDVIFNYNHGGKVMARTRNQTLQLTIDNKGLYVRARLDGTSEGRKLYEEIRGGYIDRMSFAFTVAEDEYQKETRTRVIRKVKKLYDVSAVDIPAYDTTSISARSFFEAQEEIERKEKEKRKRLLLMTLT
jgi:HK97 family phage prohead protease